MNPHPACRLAASLLLYLALPLALSAVEPPGILNHQGRVAVDGVNFTGTGYFKFVLTDAAGTTTLWSNDGTSSGGGEPTGWVTTPVVGGHYALAVGDTTLPGMTQAIPASVFRDNDDVRLRIWFGREVGGGAFVAFEQLAPDRRLAAGAYALSANTASTLAMPETTDSSTGVVTQGGDRFMHSFGTDNFFAGRDAGNFTLGLPNNGDGNVGIGVRALEDVTTGDNNTALGFIALANTTSGNRNTVVGKEGMFANTTGAFNTASGVAVMAGNVSGDHNVAMGYVALLSADGARNTALGSQAAAFLDGNDNTALGYQAGYNTAGDNNILLGANVLGMGGESNTTRIGNNQDAAYIDGIRDVTPGGATLSPVYVDENGQLGTGVTSALTISTTGNFPIAFSPNGTTALRLEYPLSGDTPNLIGGSYHNSVGGGTEGAFIGGGGGAIAAYANTISVGAHQAVIGGGFNNDVQDTQGTVAGGRDNTVTGAHGFIGGGQSNTAGQAATVGGGFLNIAPGLYATIPGGRFNYATGEAGFAAGSSARADHNGSFVWADSDGLDDPGIPSTFSSTARDQFLIRAGGGVGIGLDNPQAALDVAGTVRATAFSGSGGDLMFATTDTSAVEFKVNNSRGLRIEYPDGFGNTVPNLIGGYSGNSVATESEGTVIAGGGLAGFENKILPPLSPPSPPALRSDYATISGGFGNEASGQSIVIGGGARNIATANLTTIGGGQQNQALQGGDTVAGGDRNIANGGVASVGGGGFNEATGSHATVPGGDSNTASGDYSFAAGRYARAEHKGSFVWSDSGDPLNSLASTGPDQFLIKASGGVGIGTNAPDGALHTVGGRIVQESSATPLMVDSSAEWPDEDLRIIGNDAILSLYSDNVGGANGAIFMKEVDAGGLLTSMWQMFRTPGNDLNFRHGTDPSGGGTDHLTIKESGNVGIGTTSPGSTLEVTGSNLTGTSDGTGLISAGPESGFHIALDADDIQAYDNNSPTTLYLNYWGGNIQLGQIGSTATTTVYGTFVNSSDRDAKEDIRPIEPADILDRLVGLPLATWQYKGSQGRRHVGPMAQDFHAAFNDLLDLKADERTIAPLDEAGVAFASIQALHAEVEEKDARIDQLADENADLRQRLEKLEAAVEKLAR